ncbi:hypothetical protein Sfulv_55740 [Streptomyces fulvorobeus]|uniref:Uncharacterized protein n=2 Tax=Streptomyces fulvorobeus TaxID=284028 RepID=A0A7J0CFS8_9ACTN|nr:hypothetical protein Sfulv_55740 [Streptomyces fulvorobeus]
MTYSPNHIADGQHLTHLMDTLERDLIELRQLSAICGDAVTMPGRRPEVDADGTGRAASSDPGRPTESIALDSAREALRDQLEIGISYATYAIAYVRGATASMDRALSRWEGEDAEDRIAGECHGRIDGTEVHSGADGRPDGVVRDAWHPTPDVV